jgi:hypothetical protein
MILLKRRRSGTDTTYVVHLTPAMTIENGLPVPDPEWVAEWTFGCPPEDDEYPRDDDGQPTGAAWAAWDETCMDETRLNADAELQARLDAIVPPLVDAVILPGEGMEL